MGTMANELALGCDCLGQIHYLVCIKFSPPLALTLTQSFE